MLNKKYINRPYEQSYITKLYDYYLVTPIAHLHWRKHKGKQLS